MTCLFFFQMAHYLMTKKHEQNCTSKWCTSICILRWVLNDDNNVRKIANDNSKTAGTEETPFFDNATQRYCLMAVTNISWVQNTGPAFWRHESINSRDRILDLNSWDLKWNKRFMKSMSGKLKEKKSWSWKKTTFSPKVKRVTHLGSNGASDSGFIESLHRDLNTRNASFCVMWENLTAPPPWLLREVDDALPSTSAPDSLWVSPSSSDIGDDVSVGVEGTWRSYCGSPLMFGFSGLLSFTSPFARMLWSNDKS